MIKRSSSQGLVYQGTQPHPSPAPASGGNSSPGRINASPEGPLSQQTHPRLAQLGQTLSCSDLGQIALPVDRIACAFNVGIA
jgi:hypothetical protein